MPPVLHFYSDWCTVPDTNSTLSSLLKGDFRKGISVLSAIRIHKYCKFHIIQLFIQADGPDCLEIPQTNSQITQE